MSIETFGSDKQVQFHDEMMATARPAWWICLDHGRAPK
jgi:hypothetical protein